MRAVDLFAGAGGFTCGAEAAGLKVVFAANHWQLAVNVHEANHPHVSHACQDLRQFDFATLPDFDILLASPACQGHSRVGRPGRKHSTSVKQTHNNLRSTAWAVIDCLEVCRPRWVVVENVPEFASWELMPEWLGCMRRLGYAVTEQVLTASRWETPQRRERVIYIGHHEGQPLALLDPDTREPDLRSVFDTSAKGWIPISKMRKTVSKKGHKTAREKVEIANTRLGGELGWGQHVNSPSTWGRSIDEPVNTITRHISQFWWVRDGMYRLWTVGEALAAMSFPRDYNLLGANKRDAGLLIGNAIPPKLSEGILREVSLAA